MNDFPLYRSKRALWLGTLIIAAPLLFSCLFPVGAVYTVMLVLYLLPIAACMAGAIGGALPMGAGVAAGLLAMYLATGAKGLGLSAVYLLPIVGAFVLILRFRVPFWRGCAIMIAVHVAALAAVYLLLQQITGGDFYRAAGAAAASALENWELGDAMLYQLYAMGLVGLPEGMEGALREPTLFGILGYGLTDAARADMLKSVQSLVSAFLMELVPGTIVSQSILGGVMCLFLPLRFGFMAEEKRVFKAQPREDTATDDQGRVKINFPDLGMPPLEKWYIPRGMGWQAGAALVAGYILRRSASPAAAVAGAILYAAAVAIFDLQGLALIHFMQKARNVRRAWRVIVPLALMAFSVLVFVGIFDQISNIRGLRKPPESKEGFGP